MLITCCLLRSYLLRKAIIFNTRPTEPPEPAARARAHLLSPLMTYLHLAGERIDLLRASSRAGWTRAPGLLAAAPRSRASNVSESRPAPGPAAASNIEQQRHLASTCSNAVQQGEKPMDRAGRSQTWPKGGKWEEGVSKWVRGGWEVGEGRVLGRELPGTSVRVFFFSNKLSK